MTEQSTEAAVAGEAAAAAVEEVQSREAVADVEALGDRALVVGHDDRRPAGLAVGE